MTTWLLEARSNVRRCQQVARLAIEEALEASELHGVFRIDGDEMRRTAGRRVDCRMVGATDRPAFSLWRTPLAGST